MNMDTTSVLKALQNPTRLKILEDISANKKGVTSKDVSERIKISQSMAQRHLEQLERAGLLKSKHEQPPIGAPRKRFFLNKRIEGHEVMNVGKLRIYLDLIEDNREVGK